MIDLQNPNTLVEAETLLAPFRSWFTHVTWVRGCDYALTDRVEQVKLTHHPLMRLQGRVHGRDEEPYIVEIEFNQAGEIEHSECTCPVGFLCKHIVATLIVCAAHPKMKKILLSKQVFQPSITTLTSSTLETTNTPLTDATSHWLAELAFHHRYSISKPISTGVLFYSLDSLEEPYSSTLKVRLQLRDATPTGGFGEPSPFCLDDVYDRQRLTSEDRSLLDLLVAFQEDSLQSSLESCELLLNTACTREILPRLLKTKRLVWQSEYEQPMRQGAPIAAKLIWDTLENGDQQLTIDQSVWPLPTEPLWYLDKINRRLGPLTTKLPEHLARPLLFGPTITPIETKPLVEALSKLTPDHDIPLPKSYHTIIEHEKTPPKPCLKLRMYEPFEGLLSSCALKATATHSLCSAELSFQYGSQSVNINHNRAVIDELDEATGTLIRHRRDPATEKNQVMQLYQAVSPECLPEGKPFNLSPAELEALDLPAMDVFFPGMDDDANVNKQALLAFHAETLPQLEESGWCIERLDDYPFQSVLDVDEWYTELNEKSAHDWFEVELGVMVRGERINLLPYLLESLEHSELQPETPNSDTLVLQLPKGKLLKLPRERTEQMLHWLTEFYQPKEFDESQRLRLSRYKLGLLAEMQRACDANRLRYFGPKKILDLSQQLGGFKTIKSVAIPKQFQATLRPYQRQGVNWLQFLRRYELNGILADDMGLGKTVQTLAHLAIEKKQGRLTKPALIITPTSVLANWHSETERFAPHLKILVLRGKERALQFHHIPESDLILTTYPLIVRDKEIFLEYAYHYFILDEAQYIKNPQTKLAQVVCQIKANHRLCLTGTPLENHLGELWSQFNFLLPGLLGERRQFYHHFRMPIEKGNDGVQQKLLASLVKPFILRRTKKEVVPELPQKTEILHFVQLDAKQRDLYETLRVAMHKKVRTVIDRQGLERSQIIILDALLKLRQTCCDPRLLALKSAKRVKQSAKLEALFELVVPLLKQQRRIIIFSQFTRMLKLIADKLTTQKLPFVQLTGQTVDRKTPVTTFQEGEVPIFLISLKAGGTGLNLTAADTVIHYDPWWNPQMEQQATDRAYRIGQEKPVQVYKMIVKDSVEEKILAMQQQKQGLCDRVLQAGTHQGRLSHRDLDALFQ